MPNVDDIRKTRVHREAKEEARQEERERYYKERLLAIPDMSSLGSSPTDIAEILQLDLQVVCEQIAKDGLVGQQYDLSDFDHRDELMTGSKCQQKADNRMKTISVDLSEEKAERISEAAAQLGLPLEAFVERSLDAALARKETLQTAFDYVLKKNAELYRRLAQ